MVGTRACEQVQAIFRRRVATRQGHPLAFQCGLEAHPSNRRRTARPVEGRDVVQRTGPTQVDSDSDTNPVDEALLDALEDDLRIPQRRIRRTRRRASPEGGLASTLELEGDVRCSSADATTVAASSNAVREAHVEFYRICAACQLAGERSRQP